MKIIKHISILFFLAVALFACEDDFLQVKNVETGVSTTDMYVRYSYIQGVVWEAYSYLPDGLNELWREAATDVAEATDEGSSAQTFNLGIWNQFTNPDDVWTKNFRGIDQVNKFLKNKGHVSLEEIKASCADGDSTAYYKAKNNIKLLEGEALFLKAYFYFELTKRYGGIPIIEEPMDYNKESTWKDLKRNSLSECVAYIVKLCDQAAKIIPENVQTAYSWYEDGRVTNGAIKSLKTKTLLYAASPLYKAAGTTTTWVEVAAAAREVIALNQYSLNSSYSALFGSSNATLKEFIFKRRYGAINWLEYNQFPIVFVGSNGNSFAPTQNFVDQFEVVGKNGSTVTSQDFNWSNPAHTANPYANRDPRLAVTIVNNNSTFGSKTIETFTGGNSGLPKENASKTGYYLRKWVNTSVDLVNATTTAHTWCYFRYADILLIYAEAMLNAYGPDADPLKYGMTATAAFNLVRARAGVSQLAAGELTMARIEHERLVELAFEDQRFWDVRRWGKGVATFNTPINRIVISKTDTGFTYAVKKLENRVYAAKMNWYPIMQSEIVKTGWTQNPSW